MAEIAPKDVKLTSSSEKDGKNVRDNKQDKPDEEVSRRSSVRNLVRRGSKAAFENITANIGDADVGVDGFLGMELKGMMEAQKDLKEAIGDREDFKLKGCVMRFADIKQEHTFHEHWRRKSTPTAVCVISFVFYLYKCFTTNPSFLSGSQNIVTTTFACVSALILLLIIQCTNECFHRWYDWISSCVILHVVVTVSVQNYLGATNTIGYTHREGCYAPSCKYLYPSTLIMLCMYGASSVFRMRFVPVAILILLIVIIEETLLNVGAESPEPWDLVTQFYSLALVVWGCLVEAHGSEILHRKTYVLSVLFHDSPKHLQETIERERYGCCYDKTDKIYCTCLKFRDKREQTEFESFDRHERLADGVGLGAVVFATFMAIWLFLYGTLPDGSNLGDYWTLVYLPSFIPLFACVGILFVAWVYWTYMQKFKKEGGFDDSLKEATTKNRRIGTCFTLILPSVFLFSWLLTISLNQGKAMNTYYEASPYEQVPCLSQSEWMEIVSEGDISVDPLNNTICAMTKGYNVTNNQTVCHPEYFEAITQFCKIFSMPTYMIFILQTTQLWIQRDMLKATIIFMTSMVFYLFMLSILIGNFQMFIWEFAKVGPYYFGLLIILYEHIIVTQEKFILDRYIKKSKAVKAFRDSLVMKTMGIKKKGITGTSRWALAAKAALNA
eukprot:g5344.t1